MAQQKHQQQKQSRPQQKSEQRGGQKHRVDQKALRAQELKEIEDLQTRTQQPFDSANMKFFNELPLSEKTRRGLTDGNFMEMTEIQRSALGFGLCGRDILGAAKTGSGKTLAFLIPVIEALYRQKWSTVDGLGALIISPTRELALQIFGVLRKIGRYHNFSAGLVIGGKDVQFEQERINRMNILVCTPGRLLQHMDQTVNFECGNLQVLVLDEADRILDLGFKKSVNAIIENLPRQRQTLLFSATQTKSVGDLARLSLKDPEYVAVHEKADKSTPDSLMQHYLVCELYEKYDILFSFVKTHLKSKIIVFLSSCKQVRFAYEAFCKLQPGTVVMCLHGKQKQVRRSIMFEKFCGAKAAVMFCTDVAARGLDFPAVDWVIQADCPEDGETYLHRVGRTARYKASGRALLFLLPSEEPGMVDVFEKKRIPITKIAVNPVKTKSIIPQLQGLCAQSPEVKYLGEKSFICYVRSVWLQRNKAVFDVTKLPLEEYAAALGLPGAPKMKFVNKLKEEKNRERGTQKQLEALKALDSESDGDDDAETQTAGTATVDVDENSESEEDEEVDAQMPDSDGEDEQEESKPRTRLDRMFGKKNQSVLWQHQEKIKSRNEDGDNDEDDDFMTVARKDHDLENVPTMAPGFLDRPQSVRDKRKLKLKNRIKKESQNGTKLVYDEDGTPHLTWQLETEKDFMNDEDNVFVKHQKFLSAAKEVMKTADEEDKQVAKQKRRDKRAVKKQKERVAAGLDAGGVSLENDDGDVEHEHETEAFGNDASDDEVPAVSSKSKRKHSGTDERPTKRSATDLENIVDEEELALKLLEGRF